MTLTLNDIPIELSPALEAGTRRLGQSLEQAAIEASLCGRGIHPPIPATPIRGFSGLWSEEEHTEFELSIESFENIDEEHWQ